MTSCTDAACHLILLIWRESDNIKIYQAPFIPLRFFVRETLRRSRTSYSTLQLALWYLVLIKPHATRAACETSESGLNLYPKQPVHSFPATRTPCGFGSSSCLDPSRDGPLSWEDCIKTDKTPHRPKQRNDCENNFETSKDETCFGSGPKRPAHGRLPVAPATSEATGERFGPASEATPASQPLCCGRRMFLAALILASKFLQDRNFTARAWSKITGLPSTDIVKNEVHFLGKVQWALYLSKADFTHWSNIISICTGATKLGRSTRQVWADVLSWISVGFNLEHTSEMVLFEQQNLLSSRSIDLAASKNALSKEVASGVAERSSAAVPQPMICQGIQETRLDEIPVPSGHHESISTPPSAPNLDRDLTSFSSTSASMSTNDNEPLSSPPIFATADAQEDDHQRNRKAPEVSRPPQRAATLYGPAKSGHCGWDSINAEFPMPIVTSPGSLNEAAAQTLNDMPASLVLVIMPAFGIITPPEYTSLSLGSFRKQVC